MNETGHKQADSCTHCHICRKHCSFLEKYSLDIGDTQQINELAYHCFLCGNCSAVCPQGIDGREYILSLRQKQVRANGGLKEKGYAMLLKEKQDYLFKNYKHVTPGSVLFPGCNFPSYYPGTTKKLIRLLRQRAEIGVVFDCCGKPVAELGLLDQSDAAVKRIEEKLNQAGVTEVVMTCPNCYYYLKPRLSIKVISIYEKLKELGIGVSLSGNLPLFLPCPDRKQRNWLPFLSSFAKGKLQAIEGIQCCGLGGCAGKKEPKLARGMAQKLIEKKYPAIYTYCGSCSGNLSRNGYQGARHILTEILESNEKADTEKSMVNRMMTKYW